MAVGAVEAVWLEVAGRPVALHVVELGLACCGVEVREARRSGQSAAVAATAGKGTWAARTAAPETSVPSTPVTSTPVPGSDGGAAVAAEPAGAALHVLVVAGTVTARLAPAVRLAYEGLPEPRAVLAFGACAATGGPYWDSYSVLPGAHELVPVDAWVPGCPPRPADLLAGLAEVLDAVG